MIVIHFAEYDFWKKVHKFLKICPTQTSLKILNIQQMESKNKDLNIQKSNTIKQDYNGTVKVTDAYALFWYELII
jgi:hypothetical protein